MGAVYITGMGMITAIGNNCAENYHSLITRKTNIKHPRILKTSHKDEIPLCEIDLSDSELKQLLGVKQEDNYTRTASLALIAAKEAYNQANLANTKERIGLINATTVGGMSTTENVYYDLLDYNKIGDFINYIDTHDCGESTERIADLLGIKDYLSTISTACSSSANALMLGARLIRAGMLDQVICGGVDALSKFTLNGFNSLMILDKEHCRPFDDSRFGLNLGEGAGFLVLESEEMVKKHGKIALAKLSGAANCNDAYHQTASSPNGDAAFAAMSKAIAMANIAASEIDYINVHGTATPNNDLSEGKAIERIYGNNPPYFSSTKPFTGHTLAACGAIEAIYSVFAIQNSLIFPSLNFKNKIADLNIEPVTDLIQNKEVKHVLSNSFGFGGNNTSIVISKVS